MPSMEFFGLHSRLVCMCVYVSYVCICIIPNWRSENKKNIRCSSVAWLARTSSVIVVWPPSNCTCNGRAMAFGIRQASVTIADDLHLIHVILWACSTATYQHPFKGDARGGGKYTKTTTKTTKTNKAYGLRLNVHHRLWSNGNKAQPEKGKRINEARLRDAEKSKHEIVAVKHYSVRAHAPCFQ